MVGRWRRGCVWLLAVPLGVLVLVCVLAGAGVLIGLRQPGEVWAVPMRRGYFAIGRIVGSADCRRLRARGFAARGSMARCSTCPTAGRAAMALSTRCSLSPSRSNGKSSLRTSCSLRQHGAFSLCLSFSPCRAKKIDR